MRKQDILLTQLMEECSEVTQITSKILRFGLNERYPKAKKDNQGCLIEELNDILGVVSCLVDEGLIPENWQDNESIKMKKSKIDYYLKYSKECGTLNE